MKQSRIFLAAAAALISAHAHAAPADTFNDGAFAGWTAQSGSFTEGGGALTGTDMSLATLDGASSATVGVDAIAGTSVSYVALVLNYASTSDNLFVKIQDNTGDGLFDRVFIYHGNNGNAATSGNYYFDLSSQVKSSYFEASVSGSTVTAKVGATGDAFTATLVDSYSGTGVGLGFYGGAKADNFYTTASSVPEPEALALLLAGVGVVGALGRKRQAVAR